MSGVIGLSPNMKSGVLGKEQKGQVVQFAHSDFVNKRNHGWYVTTANNNYGNSAYSCDLLLTNCKVGNVIAIFGDVGGYLGEQDKSAQFTWLVNDGANNWANIGNLATGSGGMGGEADLGSIYINHTTDWGVQQQALGWYYVQPTSGASIEFRLCGKCGGSGSANIFQNDGRSKAWALEITQ